MSLLFSWFLNTFYAAAILVCSPWILWAAVRHGKYREGFAAKLLGRVPRREGSKPCIWLHAVSVGEVNLLAAIVNELVVREVECQLFISTTTKTGYELARRKYSAHTVFYCPLDFSWATAEACRLIRPDLLVLAELELWPNLIRSAKQSGAQIAIVNGRLSDNSFRGYRRVRPLVSHLLRQIDVIAAQDDETAERFRQLGADSGTVHATGSMKFDGVETSRENLRTQQLRQQFGIESGTPVFLAGSTQAPEEEYALDIFRNVSRQHSGLQLVVVPRHPERFDEIAKLLEESGLPYLRRSEIEQAEIPNSETKIILVDCIGELGAWWGLATIGLVGGSFGSRGGQNMLEPAAYGVATCFGPNTKNFRDIVAKLLAAEGAQVVQDRDQLESFVQRTLDDPDWAAQLGTRARELVLSQQGAVSKTVDLLLPLLEQRTSKAKIAA